MTPHSSDSARREGSWARRRTRAALVRRRADSETRSSGYQVVICLAELFPLISILWGLAFSATGIRRVNTPVS